MRIFSVAAVFSDNMVLQRNRFISFFGDADDDFLHHLFKELRLLQEEAERRWQKSFLEELDSFHHYQKAIP